MGAGLAGLRCARHLQEQGVSFQILEAFDGIGGRGRRRWRCRILRISSPSGER
ncbi:MAG: NAD(P)-binding protein [Candidatus Acidiferrum sp.]